MLLATVFANNSAARFNVLELKTRVFELLQQLEASGHRAYIPRSNVDYAISVGVRLLSLRRVLDASDDGLQANERELALLNYYANSIRNQITTIDSPLGSYRH